MDPLTDITSLLRSALETELVAMGEPRFRASQVFRWIHARSVASFDEMSDLPAALREKMTRRFALCTPEILTRQQSRDGTRKYLVRFADGVSVETVGLPDGERLTVCFSTQAGCAMGCTFCATGRSGLTRDLTAGEMEAQVRLVATDYGVRVTNAVAMGQGEPFANYDALISGVRLMNAEDGLGIGARHLTVSTCGLLAGIRRFATEPEQFTLAVSLHSAVQATRDTLMPGVRGIRIPELRAALVSYAETTGRRPTLEYALASGVNDTDKELDELLAFARGMLVHVNLIPVNPVEGSGLTRSTRDRAVVFRDALLRVGVQASVRVERGADIDAACGQLRQRAETDERD
ncbi:MAG: 23S rRNA (adenine(2503)-C(2))-methyltransferase RlmN [Coriobacteriia bacterium]|nr:23S rRNA (adenine(2503)-C(2))-methyltransferase RlmN [Coriobacteriia bacterium]